MKKAWASHSAIDFESDFVSLSSAKVPEMQYLLLPLFSHLCCYFRVVWMIILKMFFKTLTPMRDELELIMVIPCLMPRWPIHSISGGAVPFFVCSKLRFFCILNYVWSWVHFIIVICPWWQIAIGLGSQIQLLMPVLWVINIVTYIWFNCPLKSLHREYASFGIKIKLWI